MNIEEQVLSREQMVHLVELGIDTSDASMCWVDTTTYGGGLQVATNNFATTQTFVDCPYMPAYTVADIIKKLPKEIQHNGIWYYLQISYSYRVVMYRNRYTEREYDELLYSYIPGEDLLSSLFRILCCVAETHKELIK